MSVDAADFGRRAYPRRVGEVTLTHPEKVLYPECGVTKQRLVDYYERVAKWMLPHVAKRPLNFRRCPNGWKRGFFQQHAQGKPGKGLRSVFVRDASGDSNRLTLDDVTGLLQLAQMNVLEIHTWGAHVDDVDKPDLLVFDLDPDPSVRRGPRSSRPPRNPPAPRRRSHRVVREDDRRQRPPRVRGHRAHRHLGPRSRLLPKARRRHRRGRAGQVHRDDVEGEAQGKDLPRLLPQRQGATFIAPYSTRARERCPVAMPVEWDELGPDLKPNGYSLDSALARLEKSGDAWAPMLAKPQRIPS